IYTTPAVDAQSWSGDPRARGQNFAPGAEPGQRAYQISFRRTGPSQAAVLRSRRQRRSAIISTALLQLTASALVSPNVMTASAGLPPSRNTRAQIWRATPMAECHCSGLI